MTTQPAPFTDPAQYSEQFAQWVRDNYPDGPADILRARAAYLADSINRLDIFPPYKFAECGQMPCYLCRLPVEAGTGAAVGGHAEGIGSFAVDIHRTCAGLIAVEQNRVRKARS